MTSELRPARRTKADDRMTRLEGKDPPLMTDKELALAAAQVFEEDLVSPEQVDADIEAAFPPVVHDQVPIEAQMPGLVTRLARLMGDLPDVKPEGENAFFKYKFISDKQVLGLLRPRLAKANILVIPETVEEGTYLELTTGAGKTSRMTRMLVTFRVMDGYSGESFTGQSLGYGDDAGDKGANKAYTAAFKNFLIKLCMIGGESDLEADQETDKRADDHSGSSRPITISQGKGVSGVMQGGRQTQITGPQIKAIGDEIDRLGIKEAQILKAVAAVTGVAMESSSNLDLLTFKQAGELIQALQSATPPEGGTNESDPPTDHA